MDDTKQVEVFEEFGPEQTVFTHNQLEANKIERAFNAGYAAHMVGKSIEQGLKDYVNDNTGSHRSSE